MAFGQDGLPTRQSPKPKAYIEQGYSYVVDIDLEKFFDRVCHDRLMSRLAERITDKRVLKLIRAYLHAGILEDGLITIPTEGTPQGSPLSPFLSNVVLDEFDKELEARGLRFCRYADDSNIYVRSARAGARVMTSISRFITQRLKLRVNSAKSAVDHPWNRSFLGFSFTGGKRPKRRKIAPKALVRFKARVKALTKRNQGRSLKHVITTLSSVSAWVDWLFRLLPDASGPAGLGQLDTPSSAMSPVETLEDAITDARRS